MATPTDREEREDYEQLVRSLDRAVRVLDEIRSTVFGVRPYATAIGKIDAIITQYDKVCDRCGDVGCPGPGRPLGCEIVI